VHQTALFVAPMRAQIELRAVYARILAAANNREDSHVQMAELVQSRWQTARGRAARGAPVRARQAGLSAWSKVMAAILPGRSATASGRTSKSALWCRARLPIWRCVPRADPFAYRPLFIMLLSLIAADACTPTANCPDWS
jgi:hypothetical protein